MKENMRHRKQSNLYVTGVPEREGGDNGAEAVFKELISKNGNS